MGSVVPVSDRLLQAPEPVQRPTRWGGLISISFPAGVVRHPGLLDVVEVEIDRPSAVDLEDAGIRVTFGLLGEDLGSATADCEAMADRLLACLGLGRAAITEVAVIERAPIGSVVLERHLSALPDLR